jgi:hypothetical protein
MSVWIVTVEAWDATGNGDYYEVATLAMTERAARRLSTRAVGAKGLTGAHSVDARTVDPYKPAAILITRKEAAHAETRTG